MIGYLRGTMEDFSKFQRRDSEILTEDTDSFIIGDTVYVNGNKRGRIAYIGETNFGKGDWAGVVLDNPSGTNNGTLSGKRYFQCDSNHGIFSRLTRLTRHRMYPDDYKSYDCNVHLTRSQSPPTPTRLRSISPSRNSPSRSSPSRNSPTPPGILKNSTRRIQFEVGDKVIVQSSTGNKSGTLRFVGHTTFSRGEWAGVELDLPMGRHDGAVNGKRYFQCRDRYGLFAPTHKISLDLGSRRLSNGSGSSLISNISQAAHGTIYHDMRNCSICLAMAPLVASQRGSREGSYDSDYF